MTKILLIRHGESLGNANKLYLGHTDLDLSKLGYRQAEVAAQYLKDEKIDAIYSSDLKRAMNTAKPHAKLRGISVIPRSELREIYLGDWEGKKIDELLTLDSFIHGWRESFGTFTLPGGECVLDAAKRFRSAVIKIAEAESGKTVLIAAHAAVIRSFWCLISELDPKSWASESAFPTNTSITTVYYDNGKLIPIEYSFDKHTNGAEAPEA